MFNDEIHYQRALDELQHDGRRDGLWAKALINTRGVAEHAQLEYLRLRAGQLRAAAHREVALRVFRALVSLAISGGLALAGFLSFVLSYYIFTRDLDTFGLPEWEISDSRRIPMTLVFVALGLLAHTGVALLIRSVWRLIRPRRVPGPRRSSS